MNGIRLHTGEIVTGERFENACKQVANDWRALAYAIRKEDAYAAHVTEERKEECLQKMLGSADQIEAGNIDNFTIWQRVNEVLTGECVGFLGNGKG